MKRLYDRLLKSLNISGRDLAVFLLALLLAFSIWLIHNLGLKYNDYLTASVKAECNIEGHTNVSLNTSDVIARCRATGYKAILSDIKARRRPVTVTFNPSVMRHKEDDLFYVLASDLTEYTHLIYGDGVTLEYFVSDSVFFRFPEVDHKKVPVQPVFNLVGVSKRVPMQFEGINNEIVKLAESITNEQREEMHSLQNIEPYEIVNASYEADADFLKEEGDLTHLIGVLTTENQISDLLEKVPVEAHTWAVFPNEGPFPSTLQETYAKIYSEWLPSSGYEVIKAPAFSFTKMDKHKKDYAYSEVWTPIRKK